MRSWFAAKRTAAQQRTELSASSGKSTASAEMGGFSEKTMGNLEID